MIPRIGLYRNPMTSETADEFESLVDALLSEPTPAAELAANGHVLAKAVEMPGDRMGWVVTDDGIERFREERNG